MSLDLQIIHGSTASRFSCSVLYCTVIIIPWFIVIMYLCCCEMLLAYRTHALIICKALRASRLANLWRQLTERPPVVCELWLAVSERPRQPVTSLTRNKLCLADPSSTGLRVSVKITLYQSSVPYRRQLRSNSWTKFQLFYGQLEGRVKVVPTYTFDTNLFSYERRYKDVESYQNHPDSIGLSTRRRYCLSTLARDYSV